MTLRGRGALGAALAALALAMPGVASAHAYLVRTVPSPSTTLNVSPPVVALTFDEAVEPRFAIVSVTNAAGRQEATGPPRRSPANPDTLVVPLRPHLPEGWYLVYWRAISVDGHPVQGAFTFAIGPNEGPQPQFRVPSIAGTATTHRLLVARWAMFLTVMIAIGLFVMRFAIARPLVRRVEGTSLRSVSIATVIFSVLGLIAIPVYLDIATSIDSLRSAFAVGALVPLFRVTAFGRGYTDMELCFALFCVASWIALWVDRPRREHRSIAELMATGGALAAAAAVLVLPGTSGHAGQTAPRGVSLLLDWLHLVSGSLWLGGLVGLLVVWASLSAGSRVAGLAVTVPALLERRVRLRARPDRHGRRRDDHPHADRRLALADLVRQDDPRQGRPAARGDAPRRVQPPPHEAAPRGRGGAAGARPAGRLDAAQARDRGGRDRRRARSSPPRSCPASPHPPRHSPRSGRPWRTSARARSCR